MLTPQETSSRRDPFDPPLKWAGGKRWQIPLIQPLWLETESPRLVEPFCGGLAIGLGLQPDQMLANDRNEHLINFYRWLQEGLVITMPMENDKELFYQHRESFNQLIIDGEADSKQAASLFYFLNRTCFNGLCRFNRKGLFNVPFGRYKTINYTTDFSEYKACFENWEFSCRDFESLDIRPEDFVYADPPYDVEFTSYSAGGFSWEDQVRTAGWLAGHQGPVVLVNQATDRIVELYSSLGYVVQLLDGPRRISRTGDRAPAKEVMATRNINPPQLGQS